MIVVTRNEDSVQVKTKQSFVICKFKEYQWPESGYLLNSLLCRFLYCIEVKLRLK